MTTPTNRAMLETILAKPDMDAITAYEVREQVASVVSLELSAPPSHPLYNLPVVRDRPPPACKYAFLCTYNITENPSPFLRYMLFKYPGREGKMAFPIVATDHEGGDSLLDDAKRVYAKCCLRNSHKTVPIDGYIEHGDCVYLFCQNHDAITVQESDSTKELWWALMSEICNERKVVTFDVHESVYRVFYRNPAACRLHYADGAPVPTPCAMYYGSRKRNLAYATAFGVQQADPYAMFGPFYYFSPLNRAARFSIWNYSRVPLRVGTAKQNLHKAKSRANKEDFAKIDDGGVIRYAIFTGSTNAIHVVLGHPHDRVDTSAITLERKHRGNELSDSDKAKLSRVTDRNASWAAQHDALFCGPIKNEAGGSLLYHFVPPQFQNTYAQYVIKDFRQQVPMSIHMLDAEQAGESWTNTHDYQIL